MTTFRLSRFACTAILAASLASPGVRAHDNPSDASALSVLPIAVSVAAPEHTAAALDRSGAQVVVIGRAGQDLTAYGLRWWHLAFAYRGAGRAVARGAQAQPVPDVERVALPARPGRFLSR